MYYKYRGNRNKDYYAMWSLLALLKDLGVIKHMSSYEDFGGRYWNVNLILRSEHE